MTPLGSNDHSAFITRAGRRILIRREFVGRRGFLDSSWIRRVVACDDESTTNFQLFTLKDITDYLI